MNTQEQCPCCGFLTLESRGHFDICEVCYWEDDDADEHYGQLAQERAMGPNSVQLWEGRQNFLTFGAAETQCKDSVRAPRPEEIPPTA